MDLHREACMRIAYLLPHGWRFASWSLSDVMERYHFSKHIASAMAERGHELTLIFLDDSVRTRTVVQTQPSRIEISPVTFTIAMCRFGGDVCLQLNYAVR